MAIYCVDKARHRARVPAQGALHHLISATAFGHERPYVLEDCTCTRKRMWFELGIRDSLDGSDYVARMPISEQLETIHDIR